jgi:hypothetical protein
MINLQLESWQKAIVNHTAELHRRAARISLWPPHLAASGAQAGPWQDSKRDVQPETGRDSRSGDWAAHRDFGLEFVSVMKCHWRSPKFTGAPAQGQRDSDAQMHCLLASWSKRTPQEKWLEPQPGSGRRDWRANDGVRDDQTMTDLSLFRSW